MNVVWTAFLTPEGVSLVKPRVRLCEPWESDKPRTQGSQSLTLGFTSDTPPGLNP